MNTLLLTNEELELIKDALSFEGFSDMRASALYNKLESQQQKQEPQVQGDIDYGASCEHVHPGQPCGEWIRNQVYGK